MKDLEIFAKARELETPEERAAYLDNVCGRDLKLRERVAGLLESLESAGSFLEAPASPYSILAATMHNGAVVEPDMQIGRYKLRELIGEGGMGEVYVAEQTTPLRRKVALKVIKPGMATKQIVGRFEAERQALAMMDHPHVAKVLDGGTTPTGQPFFVMELVRGMPITGYCDQLRLTTQERLELFLKVCGAVQHAHQKGIIHRDLKPSNVLVPEIDGQAVPKVIDFGVAKAVSEKLTEHTLYTEFAQVIGTPLYMSPEQAGSGVVDIDTRSDVYSLGVLLYELLTGRTPFDRQTLRRSGFDEFRRILREEDPARPSDAVSTLNAAALSTISFQRGIEPHRLHNVIRDELDWIVMKALEKDRSRRYESASALAVDVERYLADEPVSACPPSTAYQLKKVFRRHRTPVLTAGVLLTALVLTVVMALTLAVRERESATRRLDIQRAISEALTKATELRGQARAAGFGDLNALSAAREQILRAQALVESGSVEPRLVAQVWQLADALDEETRDQQLLAALDAAWLAEPTLSWDRRFASEQSVRTLRDAVTADGLVVGQGDAAEAAARIRGRQEKVRSEIVAALYEWYVALAPPIGVSLKRLTEVDHVSPISPAGRDGRLKRGDRIVGIGQGPNASITSTAEMTRRQIRQLVHGEPGTAVRLQVQSSTAEESQTIEIRRDTTAPWLWAVVQAADPDPWRRRVREASELEDLALRQATLEELVAEADLSHQPVRFLNQLAAQLARAKAIDSSLALLREVWQLHPDDIGTNISLAICLRRLQPAQLEESLRYYSVAISLWPESGLLRNMRGFVFTQLGKNAEAIADYREAIRVGGRKKHVAHDNLGNTLGRMGRLEESVAEHRAAIRIKPDFYKAHRNLGISLAEQGKLEEAVSAFREAIRHKPDYYETFVSLGVALKWQGKLEEAVTEYRRAIQVKPKHHDAYLKLGLALAAQGKWKEAISEYREAVRLRPDLPDPQNDLAWLLVTAADHSVWKPSDAVELATAAVELAPSANHWNTLGVAQYRAEDFAAAVSSLKKSVELDTDRRNLTSNALFLAMAHWKRGEQDEARVWYDQATKSMGDNSLVDDELGRFRAEARTVLNVGTDRASSASADNESVDDKKVELLDSKYSD